MAKKATRKKKDVGPPRELKVQRVLRPWTWEGGPKAESGTVLGLDFGTRCGFAYSVLNGQNQWEFNPWQIGYWDLSSGRYEAGNIGFLRLRQFLDAVRPVAIFYEEVKFTPTETVTKFSAGRMIARCATASELLSAFRQTMLLWAEDNGAYATGYPINTIKKLATGRGNCNKQDMVLACNNRFGTDFDVHDCEVTGADDAADAAFVMACGLEEFGDQLVREVLDDR